MDSNYTKVWDTMNELEMTTCKVSSAREILDSAIEALENHKLDKAEALMYAANEYLEFYLQDFDDKFKDAWANTVGAFKKNKNEKVEPQSYQESVNAGLEMSADGFWIPSQDEK